MSVPSDSLTTMARLVLGLTGVVYCAAGAYCLARPDALRTGLGLVPVDAAAKVELMAVYGGLELGLGLFFALCAVLTGWVTCGLTASVMTFGMLVAVRLVGGCMHGGFGRTTLLLLSLELGLGLCGAIALALRVTVGQGGAV